MSLLLLQMTIVLATSRGLGACSIRAGWSNSCPEHRLHRPCVHSDALHHLVLMAQATTAIAIPILNWLGIESGEGYTQLDGHELTTTAAIGFSENPD